MTTTVYWACIEDQWMLADEPESVASVFYKKYQFNKNEPESLINYCPTFNNNLKNLYTLKSIYDYDFKIVNNNVLTDKYDEQFFNDHVAVRSLEKRFFSFRNKYVFFTDIPSLNVTFYEYPFLEDNNITKRCLIPAGIFDIGKWFRNTEFSFFLKLGIDNFKIEKDEVYSYIRFHTEDNIKFVQFRYSQTLNNYNRDGFQLTRSPLKKIENYYKSFKNKKLILEEIKKNLI